MHPIINTCEAGKIEYLARQLEIPILFDSVESVYESVDGRKVGSFGDAECFSLHASKLINGFEGGYVTTNSTELAERLKLSRAFGFAEQDEVVVFGTNAKLNEPHAAVALASFDELEVQVQHNERIFRTYLEQSVGICGIDVVRFKPNEPSSFKNILVEINEDFPVDRDLLVWILNSEGILARPYYSPPLHLKTYSYKTIASNAPVSEWAQGRFVLLPSGYRVAVEDVVEIMELIRTISHMSTYDLTLISERWGNRK